MDTAPSLHVCARCSCKLGLVFTVGLPIVLVTALVVYVDRGEIKQSFRILRNLLFSNKNAPTPHQCGLCGLERSRLFSITC